ncbi:MarR family winged helix-turn-helix transcriptional regulator [Sphingosinicella terrae]|uniref:MarR family winged helix-turn-helix transcriptional regulator n=1 Tax=Sphingosinicella terrae TaxID=2172047 RepID=UPI002547AE4F|nr:MarR family transcriptional regulator [Sphingosinicella terrae]
MSLNALASAEQVRPPTMSRIVDALVEGGLVTREAEPGDRRSVRITATAKGVKLIEAGRDRRVQALEKRLAALSESERRMLGWAAERLERLFR